MDTSKLSSDVLEAVRQNLGCEKETDGSKDNVIADMGPQEVFDRFLVWNGIQGYTRTIWDAVECIKDADRKDDIAKGLALLARITGNDMEWFIDDIAETDTAGIVTDIVMKRLSAWRRDIEAEKSAGDDRGDTDDIMVNVNQWIAKQEAVQGVRR